MVFGIRYLFHSKKADEDDNLSLTSIAIPSGKYTVFSTDFGGFADNVLSKLRGQIFDSWLPDSGYKQTDIYEVEVYYLYPKTKRINTTMRYRFQLNSVNYTVLNKSGRYFQLQN